MSIATLLSEVQHNPDSLKYHTFDIDEREDIQKLWKEVQMQNQSLPRGSNVVSKKDVSAVDDAKQKNLPQNQVLGMRINDQRLHNQASSESKSQCKGQSTLLDEKRQVMNGSIESYAAKIQKTADTVSAAYNR